MDVRLMRLFTGNPQWGKPPKRKNPKTPSTQEIMLMRGLFVHGCRPAKTAVPWQGDQELRQLKMLLKKMERQFQRKIQRANKHADQMTAHIENETAKKIARRKIVNASTRVSGNRMARKGDKIQKRINAIENNIRSLKGASAI